MKRMLNLFAIILACIMLVSCVDTQTTTTTAATTNAQTAITPAYDKIYFAVPPYGTPESKESFEAFLKAYREAKNLPTYSLEVYWVDGAKDKLNESDLADLSAYKISKDTFHNCYYVDIGFDALDADSVLALVANENVEKIRFVHGEDVFDN